MALLGPVRKPRARKFYKCNACEWIFDAGIVCDIWEELTYTEKRALAKARKARFKIIPGQVYIKVPQVCCGEFFVFRGIPEIDAICQRLDLYEDAC